MNKVIIKKNNVIKKSAKLFYYNGYKNKMQAFFIISVIFFNHQLKYYLMRLQHCSDK